MKKNLKLNDVQYVKMTYDDRWGNSHCSKAVIKAATSRELTLSIKYEEYIFIKSPQKVELGFVCQDGLYKTSTTLKSVMNADPYIIVYLEMPENISYQQNREYFRVNILEGAIISYAVQDGIARVTCKTHDISANGVCLELPSKFDLPDDVNINILFRTQELKLTAKTKRITTQNNTVLASFEFVDIKEQDRDYISKLCIQKQLEQKRDKVE